jgi:hypothetical protein
MIFLKLKIDNFYMFKDTEIDFTYPKKIIKHYPMTDRLIVRGGYYRHFYIDFYDQMKVRGIRFSLG